MASGNLFSSSLRPPGAPDRAGHGDWRESACPAPPFSHFPPPHGGVTGRPLSLSRIPEYLPAIIRNNARHTAIMAQNQTPQNVAESATQSAKIPGNGPLLLGVFGSESAPEALIRLPGGKTETVAVGDSVAGQKVMAIDETRIALARGGKARWLELPGTR